MHDTQQHLDWGAEALWKQLDPLLPGISVEVVARVDSTNTSLIDRARRSAGQRDVPVSRPGEFDPLELSRTPHGRRAGDTQPCLLVAIHQARGRGRMGRTWQSSAGASLTFSLALALSPVDWSGLSLAVGVALADALDPPEGKRAPRILLKWPNDLCLADAASALGGRKLGGVLIETVPVGERRMTVVGVGLNVLPQALEDLSSGYACLQEIDPAANAPAALGAVAAPLVRALQRFERGGFAAFAEAYRARDVLAGRAVSTTMRDAPDGIVEGVDARGALRLVREGRVHTIVSGEVSVRPPPGGDNAC